MVTLKSCSSSSNTAILVEVAPGLMINSFIVSLLFCHARRAVFVKLFTEPLGDYTLLWHRRFGMSTAFCAFSKSQHFAQKNTVNAVENNVHGV